MIKVEIKKQNIVTNSATFENQEQAESWLMQEKTNGSFGKPERWLADTPMNPLSEEEKALAIESRKVVTVEAKPGSTRQVKKELEDGSVVLEDEVIPAVEEQFYMEYKFAAEYAIDIEDITAQVEAEKAAKEAKRLAKEKRKADRKLIDWSKNLTTKQLQEVVKALIEELND